MKNLYKIIIILSISTIVFAGLNFIPRSPNPQKNLEKIETKNRAEGRWECLRNKSDIIYERYAQCVKDARGNNNRCLTSASSITCPF